MTYLLTLPCNGKQSVTVDILSSTYVELYMYFIAMDRYGYI